MKEYCSVRGLKLNIIIIFLDPKPNLATFDGVCMSLHHTNYNGLLIIMIEWWYILPKTLSDRKYICSYRTNRPILCIISKQFPNYANHWYMQRLVRIGINLTTNLDQKIHRAIIMMIRSGWPNIFEIVRNANIYSL